MTLGSLANSLFTLLGDEVIVQGLEAGPLKGLIGACAFPGLIHGARLLRLETGVAGEIFEVPVMS